MREPRIKVRAPYENPEEKFSDLKNLLMKSHQSIEKLIEDCLHQLTVSKSELERLQIWAREHEIKNIGICELEPKSSTSNVEPKRLSMQPEMKENVKVLQKMPDEKDDLTLRSNPKITESQEGNSQLLETKLGNEKSLSLLFNLKQQIEIICKRHILPSRPVETAQVPESKVKSLELKLRRPKNELS